MYNTIHIWPLLCVLLPTTLDQLFKFIILDSVLVEPTVILDSVHDHDFVHVLEWDTPARNLPRHGTDRLDIRTLGVVLLLDEFRSHLVHGAPLVETVSIVDFVA